MNPAPAFQVGDDLGNSCFNRNIERRQRAGSPRPSAECRCALETAPSCAEPRQAMVWGWPPEWHPPATTEPPAAGCDQVERRHVPRPSASRRCRAASDNLRDHGSIPNIRAVAEANWPRNLRRFLSATRHSKPCQIAECEPAPRHPHIPVSDRALPTAHSRHSVSNRQ